MSPKPVVLRETAEAEAQAAINDYELEAGAAIALDFVTAYEAALIWIGAHPGAGSSRYAEAARLPGLRSHKLGRLPYALFYLDGGKGGRPAHPPSASRHPCDPDAR